MNRAAPPPGFSTGGQHDVSAAERPGATVEGDGVRFEVWAPYFDRVEVVIDPEGATRTEAMAAPDRFGCHTAHVPGVGHGTRYGFRTPGGKPLADPASRWQPEGVFGPSAVLDPARFEWTASSWNGVALADTVLYELHVGTFTPEGTLDAAIGGLDRLAALGITTIELMPLGQFSGRRGWGYDGVFPLAVQNSYGGPSALARFVDAAHGRGLAVVLDVVFNHFGPEGNVLPRFGPYVTDAYVTSWGPAVNLSGPASDQVRRLFLDAARMWIDDFRADGLRVDAADAIIDPTALPFLEELTTAVHELGTRAGRTVLTFFETSANAPRTLEPSPSGLGADAQWNDEFHHALRVALTGDRSGYYVDYRGVADLADVFEHRFTYRGRYSEFRGRRHGRSVEHLDPIRFVVADQNHDQVGNRRDGERLDVLVDLERRKLALAATLLSPFVPLLFMGEEYGETAPFPFFADHASEELRAATRAGRREEFAAFGWSSEPPDPFASATFRCAVLRTDLIDRWPHAELSALTTELLRLRRAHPVLTDADAMLEVAHDGSSLAVRRRSSDADTLLTLNFSDHPAASERAGRHVVLDTSDIRWAGPGVVEPTAGTVTVSPWSAALSVG